MSSVPAFRSWHQVTPVLAFNDPREVWATQPTFLIAELLFLFLAIVGLADAAKRPRGFLTFVSCLVGGAAVELVTILHGEVGNFYHSQATIMLFGRREPLYMLLGCYGWIAHAAMLLTQRLGGSSISMACYAALLGSEAWALLDTVGARFIWWHWHNSEPLYDDREGGVPVASSFWIMASMGSLALALLRCPDQPIAGLLVGPIATLGLMHIPFLVLFHPLVTFAGLHASYAMWSFRIACALPLLPRLVPPARARPDAKVLAHILLFVGCMCLIACLGDPSSERRTSYAQACIRKSRGGELESSFWGGFERRAFVSSALNMPDEDLYQLCDPRCDKANEPLDWYTTCGVASDGLGFQLLILAHAAVVVLLALLPFDGGIPMKSAAGVSSRTKKKD